MKTNNNITLLKSVTVKKKIAIILGPVYMIGGVTRQGGQPAQPDQVTLSAGVKFCHVNVSRWGSPPSRGQICSTEFAQNSLWR